MSFKRKRHPHSSDHEVAVFRTKVKHEVCIDRGLSDGEVVKLIRDYLDSYERVYPDTRDEVKPPEE